MLSAAAPSFVVSLAVQVWGEDLATTRSQSPVGALYTSSTMGEAVVPLIEPSQERVDTATDQGPCCLPGDSSDLRDQQTTSAPPSLKT